MSYQETEGGAYTNDEKHRLLINSIQQGGAPIINSTPYAFDPHTPRRYVIKLTGICTMTILPPSITAPNEDGLRIRIISATGFAHVLTFTGGTLRSGAAGVATATFAAFAGATLTLVAVGGLWLVESSNGVTFA